MERQLVEARASEECGCPEELWIVWGCIELLIHLEEDGSGHMIAYTGEDEFEQSVDCGGLEDLRNKAFAWAETWPEGDE